jgi:hypothetical protein
MKKHLYSGINIQFPISNLILSGKKTIETRTYPIPSHYINQEIILVETPGKSGKFKSRAIAIIKFGPSFEYKSKKDFYSDTIRHCVTSDSPWAWDAKKGKWGWPVQIIKTFRAPIIIKKRLGIKFTKNLEI